MNLDGAKVWTTSAAAETAARKLNLSVEKNPFLSYSVVPSADGFLVVLTSCSLTKE